MLMTMETLLKNMDMSIPTLILFKDGKEQTRIVGFRPKGELAKAIEAVLN